jgi:O-antigen ligase
VVFAILCGELFRQTPRQLRILIVPALIIGGAGLLLYLSIHGGELIASLYDNATLTGRGRIWQMLGLYIADHPWTGAGFGSFWNIGDYSPVTEYGSGWITNAIVSGHNGYLDLAVSIGIPGMTLVIIAMIVWPIVVVFTAPAIQPSIAALVLAMVLFCAGQNFSESTMFDRDSPVQVLWTLAIALSLAAAHESGRGISFNRSLLKR